MMNRIRLRRLCGIIVLLLLSGVQACADPVLFLVDGNTSSLYTVAPTSGNATQVGNLGVTASLLGLAYDTVNDQLYMTSTSDLNSQLYRVDVTTGQANLVGDTGFQAITGLTFDSDSQVLYGGSGASDSLFTLDVLTGAATTVGSFGVDMRGHGMGYDPQTQRILMTDGSQDRLFAVDKTTGAATEIGATGLDSVAALAFHTGENRLYGINTNDDTLVRLNTSTGAGEVVGNLGFDAFNVGLAFRPSAVPEPSSWMLLVLLGIAAILRTRRRSRSIAVVPNRAGGSGISA
ncbi:PEP-CTERM sorting domain-containing protein [Rhodopirellula sp. JC639]|uniref:PEP-CTERM sorting domain-containing protein n=1 Tax=Stieleria mannarensis TaxID=2755585 RepID=UPI0015FF7521|nr:PEP-CTERM sorting domain-containing protein [Rhodopirellula sp. JC639]